MYINKIHTHRKYIHIGKIYVYVESCFGQIFVAEVVALR